jgi:hypothetical protein
MQPGVDECSASGNRIGGPDGSGEVFGTLPSNANILGARRTATGLYVPRHRECGRLNPGLPSRQHMPVSPASPCQPVQPGLPKRSTQLVASIGISVEAGLRRMDWRAWAHNLCHRSRLRETTPFAGQVHLGSGGYMRLLKAHGSRELSGVAVLSACPSFALGENVPATRTRADRARATGHRISALPRVRVPDTRRTSLRLRAIAGVLECPGFGGHGWLGRVLVDHSLVL